MGVCLGSGVCVGVCVWGVCVGVWVWVCMGVYVRVCLDPDLSRIAEF